MLKVIDLMDLVKLLSSEGFDRIYQGQCVCDLVEVL